MTLVAAATRGTRTPRLPAGPAALAGALCLTLVLVGCAHAPKTAAKAEAPPTATAAAPSAPLTAFSAARAREIELANQAALDIAAATAQLPGAQQAKVRGVATASIEAVDGARKQRTTVSTFESLTVDLPLALKGKPERDAAMAPVKSLAEFLARQRGAAEIARGYTPADARNENITADSATAKTPDGRDIVVRKFIDANLLRGSERIIVKGAALNPQL